MSAAKRENMFLNLGFNLILPVLILNKGDKWSKKLLPDINIDPAYIMVLALAFPVGYFIYDYARRRKRNLLSILGAVGVLLTGSISLAKLPPIYFAVKETLMPLLIGIFIIISTRTKNPLIHALLYNPDLFEVERIDSGINTPEKRLSFHKLMQKCTWIIAISFLVSAILNFVITVLIVQTDPRINQALYNEEVSKQMVVSIIVISLCTMPITIYAMLKLFKGIEQMTGLKMEDVLRGASDEKVRKQ